VSDRRAISWLLAGLLLQLGVLAAVIAVAAAVFEARSSHDRQRVKDVEQRLQVLCARKDVTGVRLTGGGVKVSTANGC
jgi:hypothetical protein